MNRGVKYGNVSGGHCYMNTHTKSEAKEQNLIDYTNRSDESTPNKSEMENTGLQDCVDIDVMLQASKIHQYPNMEYNN